jgi:hypothetical protein
MVTEKSSAVLSNGSINKQAIPRQQITRTPATIKGLLETV